MADAKTKELLPCPFCDNAAEPTLVLGAQTVMCSHCSAHCGLYLDQDGGRDRAAEAWNARAAPQPAASDVPHDVVRALEIAQLLREADAHIVWEANGLGNDFADRVEAALATPAPSTSTEEGTRPWHMTR